MKKSSNRYAHPIEAFRALKARSYKNDFKFEDGKMHCLATGKKYTPSELTVREYHRFEGRTNPSDMSILFAIECKDGNKGLLFSAYGTYADHQLIDFLNKVPIKVREDG
ncbi:MAG: hypothetical protein D6765_09845 [Bacteroidetes bacterium]|nr:MAG: hypothetical protein D6765_09845 [Bacteroidota bacterium]